MFNPIFRELFEVPCIVFLNLTMFLESMYHQYSHFTDGKAEVGGLTYGHLASKWSSELSVNYAE